MKKLTDLLGWWKGPLHIRTQSGKPLSLWPVLSKQSSLDIDIELIYWSVSNYNTNTYCRRVSIFFCRSISLYAAGTNMPIILSFIIKTFLPACRKVRVFFLLEKIRINIVHSLYTHWTLTGHSLNTHCKLTEQSFYTHWDTHCVLTGHSLYTPWTLILHSLDIHCTSTGHSLDTHS